MRFVSLFSGVGGFDMGLEAAGWECVAQVEWDKHCQDVLARHWPNVPRWSDVSTVSGHDLPPADVVAFGSPCQDLSVAGKRAGFDGKRSVLFYEATRIIREMREASNGQSPTWIVWENVGGALSSSDGRDFGAVLNELADLGAVDIAWRVLDARWFGVPQRRRRVFVVADLAGQRAGTIHAEPEGVPWHSQSSQAARQSNTANVERCADYHSSKSISIALDSITGDQQIAPTLDCRSWMGPRRNQGGVAVIQSFRGDSINGWREGVGPLRAHGGDLGGGSETFVVSQLPSSSVCSVCLGDGFICTDPDHIDCTETNVQCPECDRVLQSIAFAQNQRGEIRITDYAQSLTTGGGKPGEGYGAVLVESWVGGSQQDQFVALDDVAPTLAHSSNSHGGHHEPKIMTTATQVRRLTPVECERLMGWPDDHTRWRADGIEIAESHRYRMCGNGVASPVAEWVATQINRTVIA